MSSSKESLELLKNKNPFTSSSAGDPWQRKYPYVESINGLVMETILNLISRVNQDPNYNCAALILGEAGSGKTDLLGRLQEKSKCSPQPFSFAYIHPFEDPSRPFCYLLRELVVNLSHIVKGNQTQLDYIVGNIYKETISAQLKLKAANSKKVKLFLKKLEANPTILFQKKYFSEKDFCKIDKITLDRLRQTFPDISKVFFKVLLQYRYPNRRPAVIEWLRGNIIDREDAATLRIQDIVDFSSEYLEQRGKDLILNIGKVISSYGTSITVCFDRLENMVSNAQISALGKMIQFLIDVVPSVIPVVCARGDGWIERFRHRLNHHVVSRLEGNYFELHGCTPQQSLEMVKSRLSFFLPEEMENQFFPFEKENLNQLFHGKLLSPRRILSLANREMKRILGEDKLDHQATFFDKLKVAFEAQYHEILYFPVQFQPDRFRLRMGFRLLIKHLLQGNESKILKLITSTKSKYSDLEFQIQLDHKKIFGVLMIDTAIHHSSCGAAIKKGLHILNQAPEAKVIYLREFRTPIPEKWKITQAKLQEFKKKGGYYLNLEQDQSAGLYALALLNYAVKEGDITVEDSANIFRAVTEEEFGHYIEKELKAGTYDFLERLQESLNQYFEKEATAFEE